MTPNELFDVLSPFLCAPGNGVYTVFTGKEKKEKLWQVLFNTWDIKQVEHEHQKKLNAHLAQSHSYSPVWLMGIPSDSGGGILRGANWGPLAIRETLIDQLYKKNIIFDLGDIRVIPHLLHDKYLNEETIKNCRLALYQDASLCYPVSALSITEHVCRHLLTYGNGKILGLGGDHSCSYPLTLTYFEKCKTLKKNAALIHFDAHTDLLDLRLGIDLCFGTWAYHILKALPSPAHLVQIGIRSSGQTKQHWENTLGIKQHWATEVKARGVKAISQDIIEHLKQRDVETLYITFDIDALDAEYASTTGTPEKNGLSPDQATLIIEQLAQHFLVGGADIMEVAPYTLADVCDFKKAQEKTLSSALCIVTVLCQAMNK